MCCDSPMTVDVLARYVDNPALLPDDTAEAILVLADRLMQAGRPSGQDVWGKVLRAAAQQSWSCAGCLTCPDCLADVAAEREAGE
jgi:hypothetical protein